MDLLLHSKLCFSQLGNPLLCNYWQLVLKMYVTSLRQSQNKRLDQMNIWSSWRGCGINNNGGTFEVLTYVKFQQKGYCCWMFLQPALLSDSFPLPPPPSSQSFYSSLCLQASECCTSQGSNCISCQTLPKLLKFPKVQSFLCTVNPYHKNMIWKILFWTVALKWHHVELLNFFYNWTNKTRRRREFESEYVLWVTHILNVCNNDCTFLLN